jgi:hypothetical protein
MDMIVKRTKIKQGKHWGQVLNDIVNSTDIY